MTRKKARTLDDMTVQDVIKKYGKRLDLGVKSTELSYKISHYLFDQLDVQGLKVRDVFSASRSIAESLTEVYLIFDRSPRK